MSASQPSSIAASRLSVFDRETEEIVQAVQSEGMLKACQRFNIRLTQKGLPDKRTRLGKAVCARLEEIRSNRDAV